MVRTGKRSTGETFYFYFFLNRFSRAYILTARIGELKLIRWLLTTPLQFMDDAADELLTTILLSSLKRRLFNHSEFKMLSFCGTAVCFKCFMQFPLYTSRREFPLELINETVCTEYWKATSRAKNPLFNEERTSWQIWKPVGLTR